ncbi:hypothetical protein G9C98_000659 [Cotesia typhae]|uniref:Tyrosine-protein phosphatase domain-containing protein n=1 Tax=Cotesia typhae TaxID=2053667 RepID=A0A8J5V1A9_9HYME|nr:hypothetical protein G9C98_000659 [Cotesia typhae]
MHGDPPTEDGGSDFINANHVDGWNVKEDSCAPRRHSETTQDFWKMIFTNQVRVIVMLTRLVEEGHEACYPYWSPKSGEKWSMANSPSKL